MSARTRTPTVAHDASARGPDGDTSAPGAPVTCDDARMTSANPFLGHEHRRPDVGAVEAALLLREAFGLDGVGNERKVGELRSRTRAVA